MVQPEPYIGIDLGTTNSCVGYWTPEEQVYIIPNEQGRTTTPSWVAFQPGGETVVGERACTFDNWVYDAKRYIGRKFSDEKTQELLRTAKFRVVQGERDRCDVDFTESLGPGERYSMEEVSAKVLNAMKKTAERHIGQPVTKAVVTVPAYFNNSQKQATKDACSVAGLECIRIINEPTAAAMACGFHTMDEDTNVVIFDLGGGTFDVTICTISDGVVDVRATIGNMLLGGRDLDELLAKHCMEKFEARTGIDLQEHAADRRRLSTACELAKLQLSNQH